MTSLREAIPVIKSLDGFSFILLKESKIMLNIAYHILNITR